MPDLVTHFTAAYLLKIPRRWSRFRVPFYLGAILPDLMSRPFYIVYPPAGYFIFSLHTPVILIVVCFLIAQFFEREIRSGVRANLLLGIALHFSLDLLQKTTIAGYFWLFPFSWKDLDLGLFWPHESIRLVPVWIGLVIALEAMLRLKKKIEGRQRIGSDKRTGSAR